MGNVCRCHPRLPSKKKKTQVTHKGEKRPAGSFEQSRCAQWEYPRLLFSEATLEVGGFASNTPEMGEEQVRCGDRAAFERRHRAFSSWTAARAIRADLCVHPEFRSQHFLFCFDGLAVGSVVRSWQSKLGERADKKKPPAAQELVVFAPVKAGGFALFRPCLAFSSRKESKLERFRPAGILRRYRTELSEAPLK